MTIADMIGLAYRMLDTFRTGGDNVDSMLSVVFAVRAEERASIVAKLQALAAKAGDKGHSIAAEYFETAAFVIEEGEEA